MNATTAEVFTEKPSSGARHFVNDWYPMVLVLYFGMAVMIILGNTLVMVAYFTTPHLQTAQNMLICNLSMSDTVLAVLSSPFFVLSYIEAGIFIAMRDKWVCLLSLWSIMGSALCCVLSLFILTLERVIAIFIPYGYYFWVTNLSVRRVIVLVWVFAFTVTSLPLLGLNRWESDVRCFTMFVYKPAYNVFVATNLNVLLLALTALMNIAIVVVAIKKNKVSTVDTKAAQSNGQHLKVTKMLLTVVGVFYLCWIPYIAMTAVFTVSQHLPNWFSLLHDLSKLMVAVNSVVNPFIYAKKNEKFRAAFVRLLGLNSQMG